MMSSPSEQTPIGYTAFERLQAEHETSWLAEVFVELPDFAEMAGAQSIVVFGASGSGKTALRMALARPTDPDNDGPQRLIVNWRPSLPPADLSGSQAAHSCLMQAFDGCALELLRHIGRQPTAFASASPPVQDATIWFVHQYLLGDRAFQVSRLEGDCSPQGLVVLQDVITRTPRPILSAGVSEASIIATLSYALQGLGLSAVWLLIDGLEPWLEVEQERLGDVLRALFSTLALFEESGFALKMMAPTQLEPALNSSGAILRRRVELYRLEWPSDRLLSLVELRLAAACGRGPFRLSELCESDRLIDWLERYGGNSPRAWLKLIRPLAQTFIARGMGEPLGKEEWLDIRRNHPPELHIDQITGRVFIGEGEVVNLQPSAYRILRYLYENRPRLCTRNELFYRALRGLDHEPRSRVDKGYEAPKELAGTLDTTLWRLRQTIEPDPKSPIYVISDKGKGVRLENTR
jgi:hypothetical protein